MVCILFVIGINANDFLLLLLKVPLTATGAAAAIASAFGMTRRVHISFLAAYFVNMHRAFVVYSITKGYVYVCSHAEHRLYCESLLFSFFCFYL